MEFGEALRYLREDPASRMTQTELAEKLNMTQRKISYLETGETGPSIEDLRAICLYFHVSADFLLGLPGDLPYPKR